MQNDVCKNEISKGSLRTDAFKLALVLRIHLETETDSQNEASNTGNKSRQECVEGEGAHKTAIDELNNSRQEHISQVGINDF